MYIGVVVVPSFFPGMYFLDLSYDDDLVVVVVAVVVVAAAAV